MANEPFYRAVVVDSTGHTYGESPNAVIIEVAKELNGPGSCTLEIPTLDAQAALFTSSIQREVQIWRQGSSVPYFWGPIVRPSAGTDKVTVQCQGKLSYFDHRFFGGPSFPTNYLANGSLETWSGGSPSSWTAVNCTVAQNATPGQQAIGNSSAQLSQSVTQADAYLHQTISVTSPSDGLLFTLVGWFYIPTSTITGLAYQSRGAYIELDNSGTLMGYQSFNIDASTPTQSWQRAEIAIELPPLVTWNVDCRLYCPNGTIIWDACQLVVPESLSELGQDQSQIMCDITQYAQGLWGDPIDPNKSDLHIGATVNPSGVLRDRTYLYSDHRQISDSLNEFPNLYPGVDMEIVFPTATTATFTTYGRAVNDGSVTSGSNVVNSATAAFVTGDVNKLLQGIVGLGASAASVFPIGTIITERVSATQVKTNNNALSTHTGVTLSIGCKGSYKANCALYLIRDPSDGEGNVSRNIADFTLDIDGAQAGNCIVVTGDQTGPGAEIGGAVNLTPLGGVTMEDVLSAVSPSPINTLGPMAIGELQARSEAISILSVTTSNNSYDLVSNLDVGDIVPVTIKWGAVQIDAVLYRVIDLTLNPANESLKLTLNLA